MASGYATCLKYTVCLLNFFVCLIGIAVIAYFSYAISKGNYLEQGMSIVFLVFGLVITTISFFGCWGAIRESPCLLITNAVVIGLFVVAEIALGIVLFGGIGSMKGRLAKFILNSTVDYNKTIDSTKRWDYQQENWECCGANNFTDWVFVELIAASKDLVIPEGFNVYTSVNKEYFDYVERENEKKALMDRLLQLYNEAKSSAASYDMSIPQTCCAGNKKTNVPCHSRSENLQRGGCMTKVFDFVNQRLYTIGGVVIGITVFEIAEVAIAIYLSCAFSKVSGKSSSRGN